MGRKAKWVSTVCDLENVLFWVHVEVFRLPVEQEHLLSIRNIRIQAGISQTLAKNTLSIFMTSDHQAYKRGMEGQLEVEHDETGM